MMNKKRDQRERERTSILINKLIKTLKKKKKKKKKCWSFYLFIFEHTDPLLKFYMN